MRRARESGGGLRSGKPGDTAAAQNGYWKPTPEIDELGRLIDRHSADNDEHALLQDIACGDALLNGDLASVDRAILHYDISNAYGSLVYTDAKRRGTSAFWDQPHQEKQILHLRSAMRESDFGLLHPQRRCQILTNMGNLFSHIGRCVEAVEYWDNALHIAPDFGMARANRGLGLFHYGRALEGDGIKLLFLRRAHRDLKARHRRDVHAEATQSFQRCSDGIESLLDPEQLAAAWKPHPFPHKMSAAERRYRRWCFDHRLFLNPLNDISSFGCSARDTASLPPVRDRSFSGVSFIGFFNQLKQEYATARYLLYQGAGPPQPHFSDRHVLLANTEDFPVYGYRTELLRLSFRSAYSLLDKTAVFLNAYLELGHAIHDVSFKSVWYDRRNKRSPSQRLVPLPKVAATTNWPLRGLLWLSKDLYDDQAGFRDDVEPDAQRLQEIRNHLEHRYLKTHEDFFDPELYRAVMCDSGHTDGLACSVGRDDLAAKALRLLRLVRAVLLYVVMAVTVEERVEVRGSPPRQSVLFALPPFDDAAKA